MEKRIVLGVLLTLILWVRAEAQTKDVHREDTLREVTVTSRSAHDRVNELQLGAEKIDMATIIRIPALFGEKDVLKGIQLLPGVKGEADGLSGFEVRGGTATQNAILLDGATIYSAGHMMGLFSMFNDDALNNAVLYKGLLPAQFGGGTSSVFDVSTRNGNTQDYHYGGTIGLLSAKLFAEGPIIKDKASFLVTARRSYLDMFLKLTDEYRNNALNFYDMNAKLHFRLSPKDMLTLSAFRGHDRISLEDMFSVGWDNLTATANWLHTFSDNHYANLQLIYNNFDYDGLVDVLSNKVAMNGFVRETKLRASQVWMPARHTVNAGLETDYLQDKSGDLDIKLIKLREKRDAWVNNFWVNDEWRLTDAVELSAGLRLNVFSALGGAPFYEIDEKGDIVKTMNPKSGSFVKTYVNLEPRLSMKWSIDEQNNLKVGYSRTVQNVQAVKNTMLTLPFDRYVMPSNLLRPQIANQVAAGWAGIVDDGAYDFSTDLYYKFIDNVYDYRDGKMFYHDIEMEKMVLMGKGRAYGLELCARKNTGRLTGWVAYTLSWVENKIAGISNDRWYTAPNDRRHDLIAVAMYQLTPAWELNATWRYTSGQALSAPSAKYEFDKSTFFYYAERNGYRAPAYHRLDLSASHTKKLRRATRVWSFALVNAYGRFNPFVIDYREDKEGKTGTRAEMTALFRFVPSVSYTLKY